MTSPTALHATCDQCKGRHRIEDPLHVMQRLRPNDEPLRFLLHERCIGAYVLSHPSEFLRSDRASDDARKSPELSIPVEVAPTCESCKNLAASGVFVRFNLTSHEQRAVLLCAGCGFRVSPGSTNRLLALLEPGEIPPAGVRDLLEVIDLGIETEMDFIALKELLRKQVTKRLRRSA